MAQVGKIKSGEIIIDLAGVKPDTRIGELTVDQFIKLIFQVLPQLPKQVGWYNRMGDTDHVLSQIRKSILNSSALHQGLIAKRVRDAQLAILDQMPQLMKRVTSTRTQTKTSGRRRK